MRPLNDLYGEVVMAYDYREGSAWLDHKDVGVILEEFFRIYYGDKLCRGTGGVNGSLHDVDTCNNPHAKIRNPFSGRWVFADPEMCFYKCNRYGEVWIRQYATCTGPHHEGCEGWIPRPVLTMENCPPEWVDMKNEVISKGELCSKCGRIR